MQTDNGTRDQIAADAAEIFHDAFTEGMDAPRLYKSHSDAWQAHPDYVFWQINIFWSGYTQGKRHRSA